MGGEELKIVNPGYSFKEFCYERGTEKWTLVTGHVGSSTGSISHRDITARLYAERMTEKLER